MGGANVTVLASRHHAKAPFQVVNNVLDGHRRPGRNVNCLAPQITAEKPVDDRDGLCHADQIPDRAMVNTHAASTDLAHQRWDELMRGLARTDDMAEPQHHVISPVREQPLFQAAFVRAVRRAWSDGAVLGARAVHRAVHPGRRGGKEHEEPPRLPAPVSHLPQQLGLSREFRIRTAACRRHPRGENDRVGVPGRYRTQMAGEEPVSHYLHGSFRSRWEGAPRMAGASDAPTAVADTLSRSIPVLDGFPPLGIVTVPIDGLA